MISLEQANALVAFLEAGDQTSADDLVNSIAMGVEQSNPEPNSLSNEPLFHEIGELTRDLHDALASFSGDERISTLANDEIPDARDRLQYVIDKTELAANKTMDAVERSLPIADSLHEGLLEVRPQWNNLMRGRIDISEFKSLCHNIDQLLTQVEGNSTELRGELTDILMAQDFQDLTGQIIKRVITLVREVEERLVEIITAFGIEQNNSQTNTEKKPSIEAEGPIMDTEERADAVSSQDDVDDLLSSLGF
ncbi:protein phosphatase CheZ [Aliivibrio kagoshimensis]|jgi:chemotaxis protein CheZ|uniref:protein phosphatase CheZ n=1 Tax=Aliivibrio kagoshimensis TaxID=2910230 RepID=UPI003D12395D